MSSVEDVGGGESSAVMWVFLTSNSGISEHIESTRNHGNLEPPADLNYSNAYWLPNKKVYFWGWNVGV